MSETTAASTLANYPRPEFSDELQENLWAESRESNRYDKEQLVGEDAFVNYYEKFRKISRDPQRYKPTATVAYIKETLKLGIPPAPLGLIKRKGSAAEINVKNYNIGNGFGKALGGSMKYLKPKSINLGSNKNTVGIASIIENLNDGLENLDLSQNLINLKCILDL